MTNFAASRSVLIKLCATALVAGSLSACQTTSISGASSVLEYRTNTEVLDDKSIEAKVEKGVSDLSTQYVMDVSADAYVGRVLLTGTAGAQGAKDSVERVARSTPEVTTVYNEIQVAGEESATRDLTIAGKLKAADLGSYYVVVSNAVSEQTSTTVAVVPLSMALCG